MHKTTKMAIRTITTINHLRTWHFTMWKFWPTACTK